MGNNKICEYLIIVNLLFAGIMLTAYIAKAVGKPWPLYHIERSLELIWFSGNAGTRVQLRRGEVLFFLGRLLSHKVMKVTSGSGSVMDDETKGVKNQFKVISPVIFRLLFHEYTFADVVFALLQENCREHSQELSLQVPVSQDQHCNQTSR
jgi:hypothetical protein